MAGCIGGYQLFGNLKSGILTGSDNLNNIKDGIYSVINDNDPENYVIGNWTNSVVIQISTNGSHIFQLCLSSNGNGIAFRKRSGGNIWTAWSKLSMTQI